MNSDKENLLSIALKKSTTEELYRILCNKEASLSKDMKKLMLFLEKHILESATIENMEELLGNKEEE